MPSLTPPLVSSPDAEEELYWLALRMVPGLGTRRIGLLLERLQTPQAVFRASPQELEAAGLNSAVARSVASGCSFEDAASQQQKIRDAGAELITLGDSRYPEMLRGIFDPPPVLFVRGRVELLSSVAIGVVGTRHPTPYGMAAAERLAGDLARAGLTITSGMARGIDTASHRAALAAEGLTIAVLGCGVDIVYPSENKKLAAEIAAKGLIVSEFPMGRGGAVQRVRDYGPSRHGSGTGSVFGAGQHYLEDELGPQPAYQTRCEAGAGLERHSGRPASNRAASPYRRGEAKDYESRTWRRRINAH